MIRLMLVALSGLISAFAAICTTVIYSTVFGWRNFWLAVCVAGFVAWSCSYGRLANDFRDRK